MNRFVSESSSVSPVASGLVAGMVMAILLGACSTEEALPPRDGGIDDSAERRRTGSILVEFTGSGDQQGWRSRVQAQFLDARGMRTTRALQALEVWNDAPELEPDSCSMRGGAGDDVPERSFRLNLLSVGTIRVEGPDRRVALEARRLPDLVSSFSGVVYGSGPGESGGPSYRPGEDYTFSAPGDGSTGGFDVDLEAPEPIELRPRSGRVSSGEITLDRGSPFRFSWSRGSGARGAVYFDLSIGSEPGDPRLKCRLEDDGRFSVPANLVEKLARKSEEMRVELRRVLARPVGIAGLDRARLMLSTVDRLTLRVDSEGGASASH